MMAHKTRGASSIGLTLAVAFALLVGSGIVNKSCAADDQAIAALKPCGHTYGALISTQAFAVPPMGVETEAEVGESVVATFRVNVMAGALTFEREVKFSGAYLGADFVVTIPAGQLKPVMTSNGPAYLPAAHKFEYKSGLARFGSAFSADPDLTVSIDQTTKAPVGNLFFGFVERSFPIDAMATQSENCTALAENGFRRELVYSGVSQGTVSILYREFINDMARPAFSQELRYDLKEGNEIGYKGARFKIIKANNTSIKYIVLKPLD